MKQILGNERNIEHLSEAQRTGKLSHAYIINGPKGSGKKTFAGFISTALLCDELGKDDGQADIFSMMGGAPKPKRLLRDGACGSCPSCVKAESGNHPDIITVTHEKSTVLSIKELRDQVINDVNVKPYYGPYKIYIIPDAQLMNENGQNALLKTIEEPPEYVIIFLLTENADMLLDTIRSRCIRLDMEKLPAETLIRQLQENYGADAHEAAGNAAFADGNLGKAIELTKGSEAGFINGITELLKNIKRTDADVIIEKAAEIGKDGAYEAIDIIRMWYRDVLVIKACPGTEQRLYFPEEAGSLKKQAADISFEGLNNILTALDDTKERIDLSVKAEAALENLLLCARRQK